MLSTLRAQTVLRTASACLVLLVATVIAAPTASADTPINSFPVTFTGGIGVFLHSAPDADPSTRVYAVPDGTLIPVECETTGTPRTNSYGQTSDVYARAPGGVYVATIYLDNGVVGRSNAPDCAALDAARAAARAPETVGDRLRGGDPVVFTQDGPDRIRGYYSHSQTARIASATGSASDIVGHVNNTVCALGGLIVSVATDGVAGIVLGTVGGIGCGEALTNNATPIASVARSADQYGKCFELRFHREGDNWVVDDQGWTMTDSPSYCG